MKRLLSLVLILLLLSGCAAPPPDVTETTLPATKTPTEPFGYYLPGSSLEKETAGALRPYPINADVCFGMLPMGDDLLLLTGEDLGEGMGPVTLERVTGENLHVMASATFPDLVGASTSNIQVGARGVTCYNEDTRQMIFLDENLRELRRLDVPETILGQPKITRDWSTLYYCTDSGIRALDLESGLDRMLKESHETYKSVENLLMNDTVLQCYLGEMDTSSNTFLSAETGMTLYDSEHYISIQSTGDRFYAQLYDNSWTSSVFGTRNRQPSVLTPENYDSPVAFIPETNGAVCIHSTPDQTRLDYYNLDSGLRTASVTVSAECYPWGFVENSRNQIYCLLYDDTYSSDCIYRWDTGLSPVTDPNVYTGPIYTLDHPDYAGLDSCQLLADEIGSRHGLKVHLWQDALERNPWDYRFEPEYLVPILRQELQNVDRYLGYYPSTIPEQLGQRYAPLELCLVRGIYGSADLGSLESANGLQYWMDNTPCIALITGSDLESTLYHELFHVMDSQILTLSNAYDNWDSLNPPGFSYDYDYVANASRDGSAYLEPGKESFIDTYSMSFPTEDRARIMENAMMDGNEWRFESPAMQAKLRQLCIGIREAFGLRKSSEIFRWEQYLNESLAYQK